MGRSMQAVPVFGEGSLDRLLVAPDGFVVVVDAEEFPSLAAAEALLSMRDIADLLGDLVRVPMVPSLDEEWPSEREGA